MGSRGELPQTSGAQRRENPSGWLFDIRRGILSDARAPMPGAPSARWRPGIAQQPRPEPSLLYHQITTEQAFSVVCDRSGKASHPQRPFSRIDTDQHKTRNRMAEANDQFAEILILGQ
jgi:hypothetical protein